MLRWCESHQVDYIVGIAKNERLKALSAKLGQRAERKYRKSGEKVRLFKRFKYRAGSWDKKRCIIAKAEHTAEGANPRFVVTNLVGRAQTLYDQIYCARGEMENRVVPTFYWRRCAGWASNPRNWLVLKLAPSGSSCLRSAR
jgi:hypothetical protein